MKKIFFFLFLISCTPQNLELNSNNLKINFDDNLSFNEFKKLLLQYSEKAPYPNIDD
ncbi:hypothetical protein IDH10_02510 [Pelagibacterales bacterium SAG-MED20]|nr:hypothetical protein [Pelagibacterales bacterium SAG-MED20]